MHFLKSVAVLGALCATAGLYACSPAAPASSTPAPAVSTALPDIACPDSTDTPGVISNTIVGAYRRFRQNPAAAVPSCVVAAVARNDDAYADSVVAMTVAMSDTLLGRRATDATNLAARLTLLTRVKRYREVPATFDRLVQLDTGRATLANYRLALAGAMLANDTTARLRYLTAASRKFPSAASIVADYNIQRQIPRLRALIDSSHQVLRIDPRRIERYATLASVYGNLDMPDSAMRYTRRALTAGVPRNDVAPSLQSLIGVVMRKAQLLESPEVWESTLVLSRRIDSTLSTDASRHLIGLSAIQVAANHVRAARNVLGTRTAPAEPAPDAAQRVSVCRRLALVPRLIGEATQAMNQGGSRFSPESVPAIRNGLSVVGAEYNEVSGQCPG